jgi:hypothetical protein
MILIFKCRSFERLLFSVEQAWWHYEVRIDSLIDFLSTQSPFKAAYFVYLLQLHLLFHNHPRSSSTQK